MNDGSDGNDGSGGGLRRIGGKLVHKGPIASVRMETFEYPDGSTAERYQHTGVFR